MGKTHYDLVVVGAGSGGLGAALAAARQGLSVLLLERWERVGGTAVHAGVHCWEMGAGGTGLPFDIYRRLRRIPGAVGIYSYGRHMSWFKPELEAYRYPGGERVIDPAQRYIDTLRRFGTGQAEEAFCRRTWHGVPFEAEDYLTVVESMLANSGHCQVVTGTHFTEVRVDAGRIQGMRLDSGVEITAETYVDASADVALCRRSGCATLMGQDSRRAFDEPGAPEEANEQLNGVTLAYRVTPVAHPRVESLAASIPTRCWWRPEFPVASCNQYPRGGLNVNMLPTMEGAEFVAMPAPAAYQECRRRVLAHWRFLQQDYAEFRQYRLTWIAPWAGVRESYRTVCEHMLTENEVRAGYRAQAARDIICVADHALDTHGRGTGRQGCSEVQEPYGVPFRCLVPRGFRNLLVACRGAGFSSIAASSCRLSRTMMQLGQAAGTAAVLAHERGVPVAAAPTEDLRERLRQQHAQVEWPMPTELRAHLLNEDAD